jgi:L-asparaginase
LETYGAGTFPSANEALIAVVAEAVERGVVVVNTSSVRSGRVRPGLYGTGAALARIGVVSGQDMTPEAALTKLYCLLAQGHSPEDTRIAMGVDMAGELTPPTEA